MKDSISYSNHSQPSCKLLSIMWQMKTVLLHSSSYTMCQKPLF